MSEDSTESRGQVDITSTIMSLLNNAHWSVLKIDC